MISETRRWTPIVLGAVTLRLGVVMNEDAACCYFLPTAVDEQQWSSGEHAKATSLM